MLVLSSNHSMGNSTTSHHGIESQEDGQRTQREGLTSRSTAPLTEDRTGNTESLRDAM